MEESNPVNPVNPVKNGCSAAPHRTRAKNSQKQPFSTTNHPNCPNEGPDPVNPLATKNHKKTRKFIQDPPFCGFLCFSWPGFFGCSLQNGNDGMMERWNDGRIQSCKSC
jgi:hypothetical protein